MASITDFNFKCQNWVNMPGLRDAKCLCKKCRDKRALNKRDVTVNEKMERAREILRRKTT